MYHHVSCYRWYIRVRAHVPLLLWCAQKVNMFKFVVARAHNITYSTYFQVNRTQFDSNNIIVVGCIFVFFYTTIAASRRLKLLVLEPILYIYD